MPTSTEQDAASGQPLTVAEIARLMTVLQDQDFAATKTIADNLVLRDGQGDALLEGDQALLKQTRADLALFFDTLPDGTIKAGDDYDNVRDKNDVRMMIRLRCGLPAVSAIIAAQIAEADSMKRRARVSQSIPTKTVL